jgi:hypothetical protein
VTNYNHYQKWLPCYVCGSLVFTSATRSMCAECRAEREAENNRRRYCKRRMCLMDNHSIKVVFDPIPRELGGMTGGEISKTDLEYGIQYHSFVVGMIFVVDGKREILKRIKGRLKLTPA